MSPNLSDTIPLVTSSTIAATPLNSVTSTRQPDLERDGTDQDEIELELLHEEIGGPSSSSDPFNQEDIEYTRSTRQPLLHSDIEQDLPADDLDAELDIPMSRRARSRADIDVTVPERDQNGDSDSMEHRRKYSSVDGSSVSQVAHLVHRGSVDEPLPITTPTEEAGSRGFWDLSRTDRRNFLLLVLLYFLQGIPLGLATGSVPVLLKSSKTHLSYSQIGVFSLASYPYSLKLLWSPIVDAIWSPKFGRRKSWIVPVQALSGLGMIYLGSRVETLMDAAGTGSSAAIWAFTWWWFSLVFACATQDIAVDGWALTLLSQKNLSYASTAQTVGLTGGQFLSYTVFLALNAPEFANRWFRSTPKEVGVVTLGGYLTIWGWMYILVTIGLALMKKEEFTKDNEGVWDVYKVMGGILKLRNIQTIIVIHLIAKIGFQANDSVTTLKLLDKGFSQEDMALMVLIDFPFELGLGYYVGKWSSTYPPMRLWCWAFIARLGAAAFAQFVVSIFPSGGMTTWYFLVIILQNIFSISMGTIMFVAIAAFHAKIADPVIGGTYMTLLATQVYLVSNLGGTFPRFFVLKLVDLFTVATCMPPGSPNPGSLKEGVSPVTQPFSCVLDAEKRRCLEGGGVCNTSVDGYYIMNIACIIFGAITFWMYIQPKALMLQGLPLRAWRIAGNR